MEPQIDQDAERRYRMARRDDLADRFGIIIGVPVHGQDAQGNWRYGIGLGVGGGENPAMVSEFTLEMKQIVVESAASLATNGVLDQEEVDAIESHRYETGPAAASWPQFFIDLYEQLNSPLTTGATLLAWGYFLKDVASKLKHWKDHKERAFQEKLGDAYSLDYPSDYTPGVVLTCPALVSLCYVDLVDRYGIGGDVMIDILPRERFSGYATPDHPAGGETYLIRFKTDSMNFYYLVDGFGTVSEHYLAAGDDLTLLPLPDLLPLESSMARNRQPQKSQRIKVVTRPTSTEPNGVE